MLYGKIVSANILQALHPCNRRQPFASALASYGMYTQLNLYVFIPACDVGGNIIMFLISYRGSIRIATVFRILIRGNCFLLIKEFNT